MVRIPNFRVPKLKAEAEKVFASLGTSSTAVVNMLFRQVVLRQGLPFDVCIPNANTVAALDELDAGGASGAVPASRLSMRSFMIANERCSLQHTVPQGPASG